MLVPTVHAAIEESGIPKADIGFVCSGSLDYLQGGPFAFVSGLDAVGAWPPIRESHVEMDSAWALYEAWVAIQTGEVDSALVYGFGKSSPGDLHEIMTLQYDPYYVVPLWPSMVDMAALQARAYLEESGRSNEDLAEVAARAQRNGQSNPHAVRKGDTTADAGARAAGHARPAARRRHRADHRRHRRGRDRGGRPGPIGVRASGVDPRRSSTASRRTASACATSRSRSRREPRRRRPASPDGAIDVAELHAQFSHEELILAEAIGLERQHRDQPVGRAARVEPGDERRARPHRRGRAPDLRPATRSAASRTRRRARACNRTWSASWRGS